MKHTMRILGLMALGLAMAVSSFAQSTSTLSGTVRDQAGAIVQGAAVKVKNQDSGDERKTVTTREGVFSVPALHAGTYTVIATAKGFGSFTVKDVVLTSDDAKSVNITLPLLTVTESVTVYADKGGIVEEDSGAKSETITASDLQDMTMGSRNAAEVVKLMSGASLAPNGGVNSSATSSIIGMNSFTASGTAAGLGGTLINGQSVDLTMDGGHDFDPGSPGANTPINPNMDMISELKVLSSSFSAEYDHGPVVVNVETKRGGTQYHGQVHFYAQNSSLNSVESKVKLNNLPILNTFQYYPGAQFSGPLAVGKFNKLKNKVFFFDGFEEYRQRLAPGVMEAVVPTTAMLSGDFSPASNPNLRAVGNLNPNVGHPWWAPTQWVANNVPSFNSGQSYAPYRTGCSITTVPANATQDQAAAAGVLNPACINAGGQAMLKAYFAGAQPNVDPATHSGWNYMHQMTPDQNQWQNVATLDWAISDNTKLYIRSSESRELANNPMGVWGQSTGDEVIPAPTVDVAANTADDLAVALTRVFSPTLTSETTVTWTKVTMPNKPEDPSKVSRSAMGLPETVFGMDLTPSLTNWSSNFPSLGPGGWYVRKPLGMKADKLMPSGKENITKVVGAHTLKAGAYYEYILNKQDNYGNFGGLLTVPQGWGQDVGNSYATVLMGIVGNDYAEQQDTPIIGNVAQQLRFYGNDHWKVTRRLTLDLGVRLDHMGKPATTNNTGLAIWNESLYNNQPAALNQHTGVSWHGQDPTIPKSGVKARFLFYSPRFGLAYDLFGKGKTIVRGGFGTFYAYDKIVNDQYTGAEMTAFGAANFDCPSWQCPVYETLGPQNSYLASDAAHVIPAGIAPGLQAVSTIDPHEDQQPHVVTYNMQIDQTLPLKFMLEASYVGNYGDGNQYQADINAPQVGRISQAEEIKCLSTPGGSTCDWNLGHDSNGVYWRPRVNYAAINESIVAGKTQYDGLQVSAHRSGNILYLLTNFTWSKSYSNAAVANGGSYSSLPDRGDSEYWGVSPYNRKFTFNASYTLTEPRIPMKNGIVDRAVNGWQLSGVTQWSSGVNLIANSGGGINFAYQYGQDQIVDTNTTVTPNTTTTTITTTHDVEALIGGSQATIFPTIICNPKVHQNVPVSSSMPWGGRRFLNSACFAPTTSGLGSSHPGYFPGPAFFNSDLGLMKTIKINERQNLQFKFQAFNFLNHPLWSFNSGDANLILQFNGQTTSTTNGANPTITTQGGTLSSNSTNFGVATQRLGHRTVQLEARYWF